MLGGEESTVYKLSSTVSPCDGVQEENKFVSGLQLRRLMAVANWLVWRFAEEEKKKSFFGLAADFPSTCTSVFLLINTTFCIDRKSDVKKFK